MRLSAGDVADEWVTQLARQGDAKVFTKYLQMTLQLKPEALQKLNRAANESAEFWDRRDDELGVFWDSRQESWDSSGTVFARKAQHARKRTAESRGKIEVLQGRGVAQPGSAPALGAGGRWFESSRPDHFTRKSPQHTRASRVS
jgi:hypothetical protein